MAIEIVKADLSKPVHQCAVLAMMDAYSCDAMGDGKSLSDYAKEHLISGLADHPTTIVFLALNNDTPYGIAVCFRGFSTFAAKPLINISDFFVAPRLRGKGIGNQLLLTIEDEARRIGCCKLSLEVQENNPVARGVYAKFGFRQAVYAADVDGGGSQYMVKQLT
ncbi:MAG: GNAT family N-acetyltransferase [Pirellulaceae bacterium]